jgi:hypothetical protein
MNGGVFCRENYYNYAPTYTGPGHASIYTGSTPFMHGIVANTWVDQKTMKLQYCVDDENYHTVGSKSNQGNKSPYFLVGNTLGDELKLYDFSSKVFSISLKDRSAILPGGKNPDGAYWFDTEKGVFITSDYYQKELPSWLIDFNRKGLPEQYLKEVWNTLYPIEQYTESFPDDSPYEKPFSGEEKPVFPHQLSEIFKKEGFDLLKSVPVGNTILVDLAEELLIHENLGKDDSPDLLAISFSVPDYIGHQFGIRSVEMEDVYLRLDKEISRLLDILEKQVGVGNFLLFVTADHGAVDHPGFLKEKGYDAGYYKEKELSLSIEKILQRNGQANIKVKVYNQQVYISKEISEVLYDSIILFLHRQPYVKFAGRYREIFSRQDAQSKMWTNSYFNGRSGRIIYMIKPFWLDYPNTGTTHGSPYSYDTHVPLIFYGMVHPKVIDKKTYITQIIPTICKFIDINPPSGCISPPIVDIFK